MMGFLPVPEPVDFEEKVRRAGRAWLRDQPNARRPRDYWSPFKPALAAGFGDLCGYSVMYEPVGSVDHYISWHTDRSLAYEWSNYRFASEWINKSKQTADWRVLDPYEVMDDWFEILLPSLQLVVTDRVPAEHRARAEYTLHRLHLRDDERVMRQRQAWYQMYCENQLTLDGLRKKAPLIARAIEKQQQSR